MQHAFREQAALQTCINELDHAEAHVVMEKRRCELMVQREALVTEADVQAAFGAKDSADDDHHEAMSQTTLELRRGLHGAELRHLELRGELTQ